MSDDEYVTVTDVVKATGRNGGTIRHILIAGRCEGAKRINPVPGTGFGLWLIPKERLDDGTFTRPAGRPKRERE